MGTAVPQSYIVIDNGPRANITDWPPLPRTTVSISVDWLGSGKAFYHGMAAACQQGFTLGLVLDHDARVKPHTVAEALSVSETWPSSIVSCNTNGTGAGWSVRGGRLVFRSVSPSRNTSVTLIDYAPWSGMLLPLVPVLELAPTDDWFFGWDDYRLCHVWQKAGNLTVGAARAPVSNPHRKAIPTWRHYYDARNGLLFGLLVGPNSGAWLRSICETVLKLKRADLVAVPSAFAMRSAGINDALRGQTPRRYLPTNYG